MQAVPDTWTNVIPGLFAYFDGLAARVGPPAQRALLEMLAVLPEEVKSASLSSERRSLVSGELGCGKEQVGSS